ncbi:glutaminase a [Apiospora phragmitis]|uniref:Glutaminase a n=1 Tax=Apiospora phragmitis TaxID=2905665 RepID=A0ABR1UHJ8_9PEZI
MRFDIVSAIGALAALTSASTLTPKVLPLVVRNPYLSTWLPSARDEPWKQWPIFYTGSTFGFAVMAAVPETNSVYPLLGRPHDFLGDKSGRYKTAFPHYNGPTFDASTTNLTYTITNATGDGEVKVILSFMSPITPTSTFRQALPASYMTVYVEGNLDISIFCDINGEWVSGNRDNHIKWELTESKSKSSTASASHLKTWKIERQYPELLTENWDHAEWGTLYFTGPADAQHQSGEANALRRQFAKHGELTNKVDSSFRKMFDDEPLFAFSKQFQLSSNSSKKAVATDSALFTFSLIQDPVVQYASARGLTQMRPLWASYFFTAEDMLHYHYHDFKAASALAHDYSETLAKDAFASGSADYRDIAALSARQVFGATQWAGTPDNPILFLKEISSNGNFQTVDVIFPAFPFFLYTNPRWLAYLLEPLLEHQLSGQYPNDYSMHDLGTHFPNATGHPDGNDEYMPVEECGNMLIMGLALANAMKDGSQPAFAQDASTTAMALRAGPKKFSSSVDEYGMDRTWEAMGTTGVEAAQKWVSHSYSLWKKWTGYLVRESLIPANQLCTDDFAGWLANQTNLALKGIVGIKAMAELSELVGSSSEAHEYSRIADKYIDKWQELGISRDGTHAKLSYTWEGSWTTIYNLYADALLCFHLPGNKSSPFIPEKVYQMQSDWYHNVLQSDWEFFAAAVASKKVRTEILQSVAKWVNETSTHLPLTDLYMTEGDGGFPSEAEFKARPVVGGHFAFLALERACGGKAAQALGYLDLAEPAKINVEAALKTDDSGPSEL